MNDQSWNQVKGANEKPKSGKRRRVLYLRKRQKTRKQSQQTMQSNKQEERPKRQFIKRPNRLWDNLSKESQQALMTLRSNLSAT